MTDPTPPERTAALTDHIDRELNALGPDAAMAVPYLLGWLVGKIGMAAGASGVVPDDPEGLIPIITFVANAFTDGVRQTSSAGVLLN